IDRYIPMDEDGYFVFDGRRVSEDEVGAPLIRGMRPDGNSRIVTSMNETTAYVEHFDAPLMALHVRMAPEGGFGLIDVPYGVTLRFPLASLCVDEWDRFHGASEDGVPFVLTRQAQFELFELLDEFDDDSITVHGQRHTVEPWLNPATGNDVNHDGFWSDIYRTEEKPGWEMGRESVVLPSVLPQIKMAKARVLVLGCGSGNDAAYFADQGHVVTGVDFSDEALSRARDKYGGKENLSFVQSDVFALPQSWNGQFDVVFEHTCYCAVDPSRRDELVRIWKRVLHPHGHLLGVFFVMEKRHGPPFGGSEWEVRRRLQKSFEALFWTRWRHSVEGRKAKELVVYAKVR
ncbi:MAG: methyltransferase domain-containing protein, partial [Calothrix sp. SM1_5_4]|nr:methyltransferase domain-containing protein [Calothrix sp. SM1_5_4]